jgi:polyisoprenyl-teichoic acid--peptidoglycan teichoic acid transferase
VSAAITTPPPPLPPAGPQSEPPRQGRWLAKRFLLAAFCVVVLSAVATAVVALNEVGKVVEALRESSPVKVNSKLLAPSSKGGPETLLLIGNDERPPPKNNPEGAVLPHSNEMLLVRIDPNKPTISMLSIPRELRVTFTAPNGEVITNRINSAYTYGFEDGGGTSGGVKLMVETIKHVLGIPVINHVFVTNFKKFRRAVDELGCVYMGVDRRYYHVNEPGGEQYFEINLQPGYQRLCGKQALEFVANRHESTSLTRDARDQRFLLEVKAEYGATLFERREKFERILGRTIETDLHGTSQVLDLLELLVESQGKPVRQVPFSVNLLPTYDTASEQQIQESVRSFMDGTAAIHRQKLNVSSHRHHVTHHGSELTLPVLTPTTSSELEHARLQSPNLPFAIEYPRARDSLAGAEPDMLRLYDIRDQQGHLHPIYTIVIDRGELGQFYDVQGTNWTDPPLLNNPGQTVHIGSRTYELFYAGEQVRVIAWHEAGAVYWIENTLTNNVSPRALLAMAVQTIPVIHTDEGFGVRASPPTPRNVNLLPRTASTTSRFSEIGALVGLLGLAVLALLSLLVLLRQRELRLLREQVSVALALEARQRPLLAAAGINYPQPAQRAGPDSGPALGDHSQRRIHRARMSWRKGGLLAAGVIVVALIAAGIEYLPASSTHPPHSTPTFPVAVLNATSTPDAAHRIASTLTAGRVRVGEVGDIDASLSPGTHVLYPSGAEQEAKRVARLLPGPPATVEPMQPQVQHAVGDHREVVVVLD